jgi:NADPH2:quinone reductase
MKAVQVTELKGPDGVVVNEVPEPATGDAVLVEVHAVGISFPDVLKSQGAYQDKPPLPFTLGGEFAGVVLDAPAGSSLAPGDRVAGVATQGAAAERLAVSPDAVVSLGDSLSFEQGAAVPLNYATAVLALETRGRLRAGETMLVHGAAGGTGTAAMQVAGALGARSIGVVSSAEKEAVARQAGAAEVVRSDGPWKDEVLALTGGRGVDLVFDPVGGDRVLDTMRCLAPTGRWIVIGFVGGAIPQVALNRVLLRNIDIVGAYFGGWVALYPEALGQINRRVAKLIEQGSVQPVVGSVHGYEAGGEAIREMAERRATGKVVLRMR